MKNKIIASLILSLFIAVLVLCFAHTAMMMTPMTTDGCVISSVQTMCPLQMMNSWNDLFIAPPQINLTIALIFLVSTIFLILFFNKKINFEQSFQPIAIYFKTYPNFSSLNFLSLFLRNGILHSKVF